MNISYQNIWFNPFSVIVFSCCLFFCILGWKIGIFFQMKKYNKKIVKILSKSVIFFEVRFSTVLVLITSFYCRSYNSFHHHFQPIIKRFIYFLASRVAVGHGSFFHKFFNIALQLVSQFNFVGLNMANIQSCTPQHVKIIMKLFWWPFLNWRNILWVNLCSLEQIGYVDLSWGLFFLEFQHFFSFILLFVKSTTVIFKHIGIVVSIKVDLYFWHVADVFDLREIIFHLLPPKILSTHHVLHIFFVVIFFKERPFEKLVIVKSIVNILFSWVKVCY